MEPSWPSLPGLFFRLGIASAKNFQVLSDAVCFDLFVCILAANGHNVVTRISCLSYKQPQSNVFATESQTLCRGKFYVTKIYDSVRIHLDSPNYSTGRIFTIEFQLAI